MKRSALVLAMLALVGCGLDLTGVTVSLDFVGTRPTEDQEAWIRQGLITWQEVGIDYEECCGELEITVSMVPFDGTNILGRAFRKSNHVELRSSEGGDRLLTISAHEFGHIIIDTGKHLDPDLGIMSDPITRFIELQEPDFELACQEADLCERF